MDSAIEIMRHHHHHVVSDPYREMLGLRRTISGLFDDYVGGRPPGTAYHGHRHNASGAWSPEVNIRETDQGITLLVALPGVEKEDVQLEVKADTLILSGRSRMALDGNGWLSAEIPGGEFYRAFSLPAAVKPGEVKATCKSGILSIELPKTEEARPRKVQIG